MIMVAGDFNTFEDRQGACYADLVSCASSGEHSPEGEEARPLTDILQVRNGIATVFQMHNGTMPIAAREGASECEGKGVGGQAGLRVLDRGLLCLGGTGRVVPVAPVSMPGLCVP